VVTLCALLSTDSQAAQQLSCLHEIAATLDSEENRQLFSQNDHIISCLRSCAASSDPFVFGTTAYILRKIAFPVPTYRPAGTAGPIIYQECEKWSIDQVGFWFEHIVPIRPLPIAMHNVRCSSSSVYLSWFALLRYAHGSGPQASRHIVSCSERVWYADVCYCPCRTRILRSWG
jgi:hypothetical protein